MKPTKNNIPLCVFVVILALTALSCSGAADLPNFFATETPTPTMTFTPSPTLTPSPTATITKTPSPTPKPSGSITEEQPDGSTAFIDYDNHYRVTVPADWLIIPFRKNDFAAVLDDLGKENPQFADAAEAFRNMDPKLFRLLAFNKNPDYTVDTYVPNLNITSIPDSFMSSMPLAFVTGALEEQFADAGYKVLTSGVNEIDNAHGVEVEYIDIEQKVRGIRTMQRVIVFQSDGSLCMITITTLPQFSRDIFAAGDAIGASIELLK